MRHSSVFLALGLCLLLSGSALAGNKEEWKKRTIYQIITDRFYRSNGDTKTGCDLHVYCGGDHEGIRMKLQYIKDLGFDAIWISPVVDNIEPGYHGYWARNWEKVNSHFGSEDDLKRMIDTAHSMGIWVMLDVVANHVGPVGYDFGQIYPLNRPEHYHNNCPINDWNNQWQVENCRLADLPDLNQDHPWVRKYLQDWVSWIVKKYGFDGIRIDTIPHVAKNFWGEYRQAAGVYQIGEVFNGDDNYLGDYTRYIDGLLNYPLYFTIKDVFMYRKSMKGIKDRFDNSPSKYQDYEALGSFVDNHDNPRFLSQNGDVRLFKAALGFALTSRGIPIFYYGSEQGFAGGADPYNRESMWNNFNTQHDIYNFVKTINSARKNAGGVAGYFYEKWADDNLYAYRKGDMFVACTNRPDSTISTDVPNTGFNEGTVMCNAFNQSDCVTISNGKLPVRLSNGDFKIYLRKSNSFFQTKSPSVVEHLTQL